METCWAIVVSCSSLIWASCSNLSRLFWSFLGYFIECLKTCSSHAANVASYLVVARSKGSTLEVGGRHKSRRWRRARPRSAVRAHQELDASSFPRGGERTLLVASVGVTERRLLISHGVMDGGCTTPSLHLQTNAKWLQHRSGRKRRSRSSPQFMGGVRGSCERGVC
jgi:hypothetical protein